MNCQTKRIFLALKIKAPWRKNGSGKKVIKEELRHLTMAFLGQTSVDLLQNFLQDHTDDFQFQLPIFGYFSKLLLLPPFKARVFALNPIFLEHSPAIFAFQKKIETLFLENGFIPDQPKPWLPHVSLVRSPFNYYSWKNTFNEFPFYAETFCVYESLGNLQYREIKSFKLPCPFRVTTQLNECTIYAESSHESSLNLLLFLGFCLHFQVHEKCTNLQTLSEEDLKTFIQNSDPFKSKNCLFSFEKKNHDTHTLKVIKIKTD